MAASLSPGSHTAPDHLVTSIFCSTLRGFCCHCHLDRQGELCSRVAAEHGLSRILSQGCEMRKESPLTPIRSTDSTPVLFRSCCWLLTELLLPPAHICRATNSTGKMAEINLSCCLLAFYAFFFFLFGRFLVQTNTFVLCNVMFSSTKTKETFGCSSSHHQTCLLPSQPAHPLYTKSMHTRPYKHTATTRNFEVIAFSPNVESCTVN